MLLIFETALPLEMLLDLGLDKSLGHGDLGVVQQVLQDLVAGLDALLNLLGPLGLHLEIGPELLEGVELGGKLGEVAVELGQDTFLDGLNRHCHLSVLSLTLATG